MQPVEVPVRFICVVTTSRLSIADGVLLFLSYTLSVPCDTCGNVMHPVPAVCLIARRRQLFLRASHAGIRCCSRAR